MTNVYRVVADAVVTAYVVTAKIGDEWLATYPGFRGIGATEAAALNRLACRMADAAEAVGQLIHESPKQALRAHVKGCTCAAGARGESCTLDCKAPSWGRS